MKKARLFLPPQPDKHCCQGIVKSFVSGSGFLAEISKRSPQKSARSWSPFVSFVLVCHKPCSPEASANKSKPRRYYNTSLCSATANEASHGKPVCPGYKSAHRDWIVVSHQRASFITARRQNPKPPQKEGHNFTQKNGAIDWENGESSQPPEHLRTAQVYRRETCSGDVTIPCCPFNSVPRKQPRQTLSRLLLLLPSPSTTGGGAPTDSHCYRPPTLSLNRQVSTSGNCARSRHICRFQRRIRVSKLRCGGGGGPTRIRYSLSLHAGIES